MLWKNLRSRNRGVPVAQLDLKLAEAPNNEWQDAQFAFSGEWMPQHDAALIGPENFAILTNMRYNDRSIEGVNGYTEINSTPLATFTSIDNGHQLRSTKTIDSYIMVHAVNPATGSGRVYQLTATPGSAGEFDTTSRIDTSGNSYKADISANLVGRFASVPQNSMVYANGEESYIYSGNEHRIAAAFLQKDDATAAVLNVIDQIKSTLQTEYIGLPDGDFDELVILTTRPIQGIKFYVSSANTTDGTMTVQYWNGAAWAAVANGSDGTLVTGKTLAQTGNYTFDHTYSNAKLMHYSDLYLFAYKITVSAGVVAGIYHMTVDPAFIPVQNVWDGVYRQPIQFQVSRAGVYEDYTLQVNQSSDLNFPVGAVLDGFLSTDHFIIMFEEKISAVKLVMLGGLVNKNASALTVQYWDGDSWESLTDTDGTANVDKTLGQTGLVYWTPAADEEKQSLFGSLGYAYRFTVSDDLSGTIGDPEEIIVDLCLGIPEVTAARPCDFPVMYKNRVMLCGFSEEGDGHRMDFSAANAPDVYNGSQTSNNRLNSVYFGGNEPLKGAVQIFNRFGQSIFAMLLVFKNTETYIFVGNTPRDFEVYPVSSVVGCPAPLTISTAEIALEGEAVSSRNFAFWLSHNGPMMFDGATIAALRGVDNYFDPNRAECINWAAVDVTRAWMDPNYREWNLLIPSGTGVTEPNVWLVYDLRRRKWFRKDPGSDVLLCGFSLMNTDTGQQYTYGGLDDGTLVQLESGTSWNGAGITQRVKTGDFWPSKNIWDYTCLRKFKLVVKKIVSASTVPGYLTYFSNTNEESGQAVSFVDSDALTGAAVDWSDWDIIWAEAVSGSVELTVSSGLARVITRTMDLNYKGFCHAFQMEVTTDDVQGGFKPILWGLRYRIERKDDAAQTS
jgi:hypothetical protein